MRIACVIQRLDPALGGEQRNAFDTILGLAALGNHLTVLTQSYSIDAFALPKNVEVRQISLNIGTRRKRRKLFNSAVRRCLGQATDWDIVESFSRAPVRDVYRVGGGSVAGYQLAIRPYQSSAYRAWYQIDPKNLYYRKLEQEIYGNPNCHFIAVSRRTKHEIEQTYGVSAERISVVYPCVDRVRFNPELCSQSRASARLHWNISADTFVLCNKSY